MCGIAGIWHLSKKELSEQKLRTFTDSLSHRGPDGSGYQIFQDVQLGFGHRRLSILDLSEGGKQPMHYNGSHLHITYNGEIYNFIELKEELRSKGFQFRSESDTEVILAAYLNWGIKCFDKFNGMWAIALYDTEKKELLLSRDRFGVKPFYYTFKPGELLAFASETIAFKHLQDFQLEHHEGRISMAMNDPVLMEGSGHTIWKNIYQLLPGHFARLNAESKNIEQKRWFSIPVRRTELSYEKAKEEFYDHFRKACKLRMRSDVPVACALSGGLDSSSVYSMLYHLKNENTKEDRVNFKALKGFVATFDGTEQDETDYARSVVEFCKGEAEYLKTDFNTVIRNIESTTQLFNEITATPISVLSDVYKNMRTHNYLVSMDGHGADEMLYGYRSLVGMALTRSILDLDHSREKDLTETYLNMFHPTHRSAESEKLSGKNESFKQMIGTQNGIGRLKHRLKLKLKKLNSGKAEHFIYNNTLHSDLIKKKNVEQMQQLSNEPIDLGRYEIDEKELATDFYYRNIPYNMRDFDRAAMQHGVEIRMPFMDYNLVNFVFSLPAEYKVGNGYSKRIMRDALSPLLPEKVRNRKLKIGMGAPINNWFNDQLSSYICDTVNSQSFLQNSLWEGNKIKNLVLKNCKDKSWKMNDAQEFWYILNAHLILKK